MARIKGVRSLVIDGELVARDAAGLPDFYRLHFHRHKHGLCVWALLHHNGRDLRELPVIEHYSAPPLCDFDPSWPAAGPG
jgi:ATP-dependent DNA ligase